jgi:flagellar biosynthesis protein FlhF
MLFETFHGSELRRVFEDARRALGDDVLIIKSSVQREGSRTRVEVVAAKAEQLRTLTQRLDTPAPSLPRRNGGRGKSGPFIIALVGPTGSGKTVTAAKLALAPHLFGAERVGFLTLDTYRVGALEQVQQYAEIANLPLEVVYDAKEIAGAMKRLDDVDVVVVDTPGRGPRATDANAHWQSILRALAPDETHLVLPAVTRPELVPQIRDAFAACRPTHAMITKVDEIPVDAMLVDIAGRLEVPMRWIADGQGVPEDLRPARDRVLNAIGLTAGTSTRAVA